ncbi:hypothetical protein QFZ28_005643 [Neobacillus niacini]|nr:hypothetical protein [Neobacillus niacini]
MNPVVGLEFSKGESQVQAFLDKGKPYGKSFTVSHTIEELTTLLHFLEGMEKEAKVRPTVILESTGHYHTTPKPADTNPFNASISFPSNAIFGEKPTSLQA